MPEDEAVPALVAGRYHLQRQIAVGGMATVHQAVDTVLDRPVAIKVLHDQFASDPAFVTRFKREAQAAARLSSPEVVAVYDWGPYGQTYYIAMELIDGQTLADVLAETGPLAIETALGVTLDVTSALAAAHEQGTIHRDIKPSNIIIGATGGAKVADFGIARALQIQGDGDLTDAGSVLGTAGYLSPEQARGVPLDPRSDLYSVGVVLFEMMTGRRPFRGSSPIAVLHQHIDDAPPSVRALRPTISAALEQLIDELLAKNPDERPPTARNVIDRLETIRGTESRAPTAPTDSTETTRTMTPDDASAATDRDERLPPTAVMPASARPDANRVAVSPPSTPPSRGSRSGWPVVLGAVLVVGLVVLLLLAPQLLGGDGSDDVSDPATPSTETTAPTTTSEQGPETITVPDVRGSSQAQAESTIRNLGLTPTIETQELDPDDDQVGLVVSQSPDPDQQLNPGDEVRIVVGIASETTTTTEQPTTSTTTQPTTSQPTTTQPATTTSEPATSSTDGG